MFYKYPLASKLCLRGCVRLWLHALSNIFMTFSSINVKSQSVLLVQHPNHSAVFLLIHHQRNSRVMAQCTYLCVCGVSWYQFGTIKMVCICVDLTDSFSIEEEMGCCEMHSG